MSKKINTIIVIFILLVKTIHAASSDLREKLISSHETPKFEIGDRSRITDYKNSFSKGCIEKWLKEIFMIYSVLKTNPWTYKIKDSNGEKY